MGRNNYYTNQGDAIKKDIFSYFQVNNNFSMKYIFILMFVSAFLSTLCCTQKTYENKPFYKLKVNETVEIYYSTNSCCYYCFAEDQNLNHIEFLEDKTIDSGPKDCAGCNFVAAFVFRAKSPGIDTVKLLHSVASKPCEEAEGPPEEYIIQVE